MTVRIVRQGSREAGDARAGGSPAERVALVAELTALAWTLAKLPLPTYTRDTMPVAVTTLALQSDDAPSE